MDAVRSAHPKTISTTHASMAHAPAQPASVFTMHSVVHKRKGTNWMKRSKSMLYTSVSSQHTGQKEVCMLELASCGYVEENPYK